MTEWTLTGQSRFDRDLTFQAHVFAASRHNILSIIPSKQCSSFPFTMRGVKATEAEIIQHISDNIRHMFSISRLFLPAGVCGADDM